jgi:LAO/AO transport system kinase
MVANQIPVNLAFCGHLVRRKGKRRAPSHHLNRPRRRYCSVRHPHRRPRLRLCCSVKPHQHHLSCNSVRLRHNKWYRSSVHLSSRPPLQPNLGHNHRLVAPRGKAGGRAKAAKVRAKPRSVTRTIQIRRPFADAIVLIGFSDRANCSMAHPGHALWRRRGELLLGARLAEVDVNQWVADLRAGNRLALARVLSALESAVPVATALLKALQPHLGRAVVIGVTGPPGAGKSTLVNAYVGALRQLKARVAVIAVDPSSPISGGAILGDRIRMSAALDDEGVFVRSLAAQGHLGGLTPAAVRMIDAFDAAGFEYIILETVGAGQNEIDIAEIADCRIVVAAPGLGDDVQAMKSGLLEIADVLVVNKGDRPGADETMQQLAGALSIRTGAAALVPVLKATATTGDGIVKLMETVGRLMASRATETVSARRRRRARYLIASAAAGLIAARIRDGNADDLSRLSDAVLTGELTPLEAARSLLN